MSARGDILAGLRAAAGAAIGDEPPEELLDAYRAEVLREAADFYAELLREAADFYAELLADIGVEGVEGDSRYWTAVNDVVIGLRRRADEQGKDTRPGPQPPAGGAADA
jgi:hypothetical protein